MGNPVNGDLAIAYGCRSLTVRDAPGVLLDVRRSTAAAPASAITDVAASTITAALTTATTATIVASAAAPAHRVEHDAATLVRRTAVRRIEGAADEPNLANPGAGVGLNQYRSSRCRG